MTLSWVIVGLLAVAAGVSLWRQWVQLDREHRDWAKAQREMQRHREEFARMYEAQE